MTTVLDLRNCIDVDIMLVHLWTSMIGLWGCLITAKSWDSGIHSRINSISCHIYLLILQVMPKKNTELQSNSVSHSEAGFAEKMLTLKWEELEIMNEVLADYKGFIEYTYKNNLMIITQGENMLKTSGDKDKTIELVKGLEKYKEQAKMLDIARLRADGIHIKVKDVLGIKDEDETTKLEWVGGEKNDTADNKPNAEVSENTEVLHKDWE